MDFQPPFPFLCPYCSHHATISSTNLAVTTMRFHGGNKHGGQAVKLAAVICPNPRCREFSLFSTLHRILIRDPDLSEELSAPVKTWNLLPSSSAKPIPEYVPAQIVEDYQEACAIMTLSPKASATLSRRCLQGIIRDFWGVPKSRLADEIDALQAKIDPLTWAAIDGVRKIGNIGAHMERDINLVVEVHPDEASLLVGLIETVIKDWYIAKHDREERLKKLIQASEDKQQQRQGQNRSDPTEN